MVEGPPRNPFQNILCVPCFRGEHTSEGIYCLRMPNSGIPYSTGLPLATNILAMVPETSASISFISFIASMMQSTWPSLTASPTLTNGGVPGEGAS